MSHGLLGRRSGPPEYSSTSCIVTAEPCRSRECIVSDSVSLPGRGARDQNNPYSRYMAWGSVWCKLLLDRPTPSVKSAGGPTKSSESPVPISPRRPDTYPDRNDTGYFFPCVGPIDPSTLFDGSSRPPIAPRHVSQALGRPAATRRPRRGRASGVEASDLGEVTCRATWRDLRRLPASRPRYAPLKKFWVASHKHEYSPMGRPSRSL